MMSCLCQKKKNKQRKEVEIPVDKGSGLVFTANADQVFDLENLLIASEILGSGTFGTSYKANLKIGSLVVKRLKDVKVSETECVEMFETIGKINHKNLLPLKAYCCNKDYRLLVYDYMPMKSLDSLLNRIRHEKYVLKWDTRIGIGLGVARAIAHLHSLGPTMFHGNINPSSILLTEFFEARVSDFLLDLIAGPFPGFLHNDRYYAPEITYTRKLSQEGDVYSFGVVLLELLTGRTPIWRDEFTLEEVKLAEWIIYVVENELTSEVFEFGVLQYEDVEEYLVRLLRIAVACIALDPSSRPTMEQLTNQIEEVYCGSEMHAKC